ncbi:MAG: type I secretion system permease/ATPase [Proteobacteria bacterium]|nr:type I secretion system permease/ATPase [Pseudomonadota bacterium]
MKPTPLQSVLRSCNRAFLFASFFSLFINIFTLFASIYSMQVLDRVLSSNSIETLIFLSLIMLVLLIFLGILTAIRSAIFLDIANWLDEKISPILLDFTVENCAAKNLSNQNLRDLQTVKSFINSPNLSVIFDAPFAVIFLVVIFFIHPLNGVVTLVGALILLKMALINEKMTKSLIEKTNEAQVELTRDFEMISANSESIKAMGMRENIKRNWQGSNRKFLDLSSKLAVRSHNISAITKTLRLVIQMAVTATSAVLVIFSKMSSGGIVAVSILSGKVLTPFDSAVSLWKVLVTTRKAYHRLNEALKNFVSRDGKIDLPQMKGEVLVEKLIYKLEKSERILIKGLSFKINAGESVAIVGPSASGKTTLARLLVGVIKPSSGVIRFDGADLSDQNFEKVGKFIGYLPQDIELFKGTIKENISRMDKDVSDAEVIKVAEVCGIHKMILTFSNGYETLIDKDSLNLSAGQKQRLALARACFGEVKFVVLDEPNSNLDTEGEAALTNLLQLLKAQKVTVILITHKPSIAAFCDRVMVLKNGEISAFDETKKILKIEK